MVAVAVVVNNGGVGVEGLWWWWNDNCGSCKMVVVVGYMRLAHCDAPHALSFGINAPRAQLDAPHVQLFQIKCTLVTIKSSSNAFLTNLMRLRRNLTRPRVLSFKINTPQTQLDAPQAQFFWIKCTPGTIKFSSSAFLTNSMRLKRNLMCPQVLSLKNNAPQAQFFWIKCASSTVKCSLAHS